MDLIIVIVCSISIAILGLLILVRNPSQADNKRFALISLALIAWSIFNYLSDNATNSNLLFTRLTFFAGIAVIFSFVWFVANYPTKTAMRKNSFLYLHFGLTAALLPASLTNLFVESVSSGGGGQGTITTSYLYPLFVGYVVYSLALLLAIRIKQNAKARSQAQKQQVAIIFDGILIYAFLAVTSNVAVPLIVDDWSSSRLGPLFTLLFVGLMAYAIIARRLFDIHFFAVRAAAYLSTLFFVSVFCATPIVLLFGYFLGFRLTVGKLIIVVILSMLAAYLLQYLRTVFDKFTKRIFFRNYYETQDVLERLSDILVHTVEVEELKQKSAHLIDEVLQPHFTQYSLLTSDDPKVRELTKDMLTVDSNILMVDDLGTKHAALFSKLRENKVALAIKLRTRHNDLGYFVLGHKQSGGLYSNRDLQLLSTAADEIAISLQNALRREEIEQFNETLQQKVTDATRKLRASNEKLKVLNETKDDFIGMASHQLRTPLTSVKGYLSLVIDGDAGHINETQKKLLTQAFVSSQRMVYLIADLLNVSRLRTGKFVIERTPTNIATMISDEIGQLREMAASRGLELTYEPPANFPALPLDETKTRQVVMNFIDNAVYYTPSGGHVRVEVKDFPQSVELRVIDDGIGVPKDEHHHLFTKFYRAKNAQRARPDGTGLGLFMAKKVIVAQGGALIFSSVEGKGSTFGFSFPKDLPTETSIETSA